MPLSKPFKRTIRPFINGGYGYSSAYVRQPGYAESPEHYIRSFLLLQKDLIDLFDYVEPAAPNRDTFSFRIHALLVRTCIEVKANCKAILVENGYAQSFLTMTDYKKVGPTHHLSDYEIQLPLWLGPNGVRRPFADWPAPLRWYEAYNAVKHNRHADFPKANFDNLLNAFCGLVAILSAQFHTEDFTTKGVSIGDPSANAPEGYTPAIGEYFLVKFPDNWHSDEQYDFAWHYKTLTTDERFANLKFE